MQERQAENGINRTRARAEHGLFVLRNSGSIMFRSFVTFVIFGALCTLGHGQQTGDENCETLPFQLHLIKGFFVILNKVDWSFIELLTEEYDELGRLQRTCDGEVTVNKCEGFCSSQVQPSVITPTGFLKECYCCRESYLKDRLVTLNHCYDPDGIRLTRDEMASMDLRLKEPAECKCFKCGDFSR